MQRIYLPNTQFSQTLIITDTDIYHLLTRVMRGRVWQDVIFFDGEKTEDHVYEITDINKKEVHFQKRETLEKSTEVSPELTLYQALPNKLPKLEYIIQKCCEIGYKKIVFFEAERSQKLVISENKKDRLHKIAIEAIEQCGGNIIPEISYRETLWDISWNSIFCHTDGKKSSHLSDIDAGADINVIVWPEGGLSTSEVENIEKMWVKRVFFGKRILRCETVGEVVWFYLSQKKES